MSKRYRPLQALQPVTTPSLYHPRNGCNGVTLHPSGTEPGGTITHAADLPFGYSVAFSFSAAHGYTVAWQPEPPIIRNSRKRRAFIDAYKRARDEFHKTLATVLGGPVLTLDVEDDDIEMTAANPQVTQ